MKVFFYILFLVGFMSIHAATDDIVKLYYENKYQEIIDTILRKSPNQVSSEEWFYLGLSYSQLRNFDRAKVSLKICTQLDSLNNNYRLSYSRLLNQMGLTDEAICNYRKTLEIDSSNATALFDIGLIYVQRKEFEKATPVFKNLFAKNGNDFLSAYYFALTSYETAQTLEDTIKAGNMISNAVKINLNYIPSYELAGEYNLDRKQYEEAYNDYSHLSFLNPQNGEYFYRAGCCLEKIMDYDGAVKLFSDAIKRNTENANYYNHLGYSYFMKGQYDSSLFAYSSVAAIDYLNPATYESLGLVYEKMDSLEAAKECYERAIQFHPYSKIKTDMEKLIGIAYKLKNYEQVQFLCEQVLTLLPNSAQSLYYRACTFDVLGKRNDALKTYKQAAVELSKEDRFKTQLKFVNEQIARMTIKAKGKTNEQ
jgi:tetratricopeptide (TPR) repeat protein